MSPGNPRPCAGPAAGTRPLPARHSAPRADTARDVAEPSRRAASAPDSPWPHSSGRRENLLATPCCLWKCAAGACGTQAANPGAPKGPQPAASRRPTLSRRTCAVTSRRWRRGLRDSARAARGRGGAKAARGGAQERWTAQRAASAQRVAMPAGAQRFAQFFGAMPISKLKNQKRGDLRGTGQYGERTWNWCIWKIFTICHLVIKHLLTAYLLPGLQSLNPGAIDKTARNNS